MDTSTSLKILTYSAYGLAAASRYYGWGSDKYSFLNSALAGVQAFAVASVFDQVLRKWLATGSQWTSTSLQTTFVHPLLEEGVYSGILLTQSKMWMPVRFLAAMCTGATAARAITGRVTSEQNKQGFTIDTKIGFLWAIAREVLVQILPTTSVTLDVLDSCVFGLAECPKSKSPEIPKFSANWWYVAWSGAFFRSCANTVAKTNGIAASITQHILYNVSRWSGKGVLHEVRA